MKFNKILKVALVIGAVALATLKVEAQLGFDPYAGLRTAEFTSSQTWLTVTNTSGGAAGAAATNGPIDRSLFIGTAMMNFQVQTNAGGVGGTWTAQVQSSPDKTNWVNLANYSLAVPYTATYTNQTYGNASNLNASTYYLLPGTPTTPTAYSAGYATPYLAPALFTNTAAITVAPGLGSQIGFRIQDTGRYLQVIWTPGGTATNAQVDALLIGQTSQPY